MTKSGTAVGPYRNYAPWIETLNIGPIPSYFNRSGDVWLVTDPKELEWNFDEGVEFNEFGESGWCCRRQTQRVNVVEVDNATGSSGTLPGSGSWIVGMRFIECHPIKIIANGLDINIPHESYDSNTKHLSIIIPIRYMRFVNWRVITTVNEENYSRAASDNTENLACIDIDYIFTENLVHAPQPFPMCKFHSIVFHMFYSSKSEWLWEATAGLLETFSYGTPSSVLPYQQDVISKLTPKLGVRATRIVTSYIEMTELQRWKNRQAS